MSVLINFHSLPIGNMGAEEALCDPGYFRWHSARRESGTWQGNEMRVER
jgi:hypothetical protein